MTKRILSRLLSVIFSLNFASQTSLAAEFRYDHYVLKNVVFDYQVLGSKQEFVSKFGAGLQPDDRKELEKSFKPLKALPKLVVGSNRMRLSVDNYNLTFDLSRAWQKIITANGVQIALDPKAPLAPQVKILTKKIESQKKEVSRAELFLPKAHAIAPVLITAMAFVGLTLATKIIDRYGSTLLDVIDHNACWIMKEKIKIVDESSAACKEYIKIQKEFAAKNPEVQAVQDALKEFSNSDPIDVFGENCPHQSGDQTYKSSIQFLNEKKKARVQLKIENNKVKEFKVLDYSSDKVLATYILNDQSLLEKIRLPNPTVNNKPLDAEAAKIIPSEIEISATDKISDPLVEAEQKFHKTLFAKVGQRLGACKAMHAALETTTKKQQKEDEGTR